MYGKLILQFVIRRFVAGFALSLAALSAEGQAQAGALIIPQVAIWPQHDLFTFEIGRALHAELARKADSRFQLIEQRRVEHFINIPCICDYATVNDPFIRHGGAWTATDRRQGANLLRGRIYFPLVADSADGHWYVDLRMGDSRRGSDERSLGRISYANTPQIVARMAELIRADQEFNYVIVSENKRSDKSPPYFAVFPQQDMYTVEVAREANAQLIRSSSGKFFVVPQSQVETLLRRADSQPDSALPRRNVDAKKRHEYAVGAVRITSFVTLDTDSLDQAVIDVRMFDHSYRAEARSLGKVRYTNTNETGKRIAQLIRADTAFKRMVKHGVQR